jgi:ATP-dependent Lhr-like helicase
MGGGAIADRGAYRVVLEDGSTRVGEVDEEFVYETRVGDTFLLGSSVWRVTDIDDSRLTVRPAPGEPARMPFWRGEGLGRSYELGRLVGEFRRVLQERIDDADVLPWIRSTLPVDADGAWNILDTLRRQAESTRGIPHDRSLVVEAFHDELGDPRVVLHSPFGRRVNGLLGLVLARRTREATGT